MQPVASELGFLRTALRYVLSLIVRALILLSIFINAALSGSFAEFGGGWSDIISIGIFLFGAFIQQQLWQRSGHVLGLPFVTKAPLVPPLNSAEIGADFPATPCTKFVAWASITLMGSYTVVVLLLLMVSHDSVMYPMYIATLVVTAILAFLAALHTYEVWRVRR